jgi:hypothetical protein
VSRLLDLLPKPTGPLWCDDFDTDLPKVVPGALEALGDTADVALVTRCKPTNGRINCPSAWWTDHGLTAFFATDGYGGAAPAGYVTGDPLVGCSFAEAVRDEWIHDAAIVVNGHLIWKPPVGLMMRMLYDVRGWTTLDGPTREETQEHVRRSLRACAARLREVVA